MSSQGHRRASWIVTVVGGVLFVGLAVWLVPWDPVPGGPLTPAPATSVFSQEHIRRAEDFSLWARVWSWGSLAVSLAVACWFGFTRHGRALVARLPGRWWLQVVATITVLEILRRALTLPFAVFLRRHLLDYGLTTQSWSGWATDLVKGEAITIAVTSLGVVALVGCARRWRRAWPVVAGTGLGLLVLAASFVYPVVFEPVFNSFTPLPDGPLRTQILRLADEEGVSVGDVLVADASRRTTTLNAYVSGFGSTRRVVVYDNLVDDLSQDEALSVVAHELAHARHNDVVTGSLLGAAGALVGVGLLGLLVGSGRRRVDLGDPRAVPLVLALMALGTFAAAPVENGISRQIEIRADVDALAATGDSASFIAMQKQLALHSLADPTPPRWSQLWFGSHPTTLTRVALAERLARDPS